MNASLTEKALSVLAANPLTVISSVAADDGRPESALVAFAENGISELFFGTSNRTRKYQNLTKDGRISCVVGWDGGESLQIEGRAHELAGEDAARAAAAIIAKNPHAEKFLAKEESRVFAVSLSWMRLINVREGKAEEVTL